MIRKRRKRKMISRGFRGWEVEYLDGTRINESQKNWLSIPKQGIKRLTLHYDGRRWDIENKQIYFQKKRGSSVPWVPDSFRIESRSIGFYEGQNKILYTVDEFTGRMQMEVKEII
jgi:hypothetical protein